MVDWSQFGVDILSGLIIIILGGFLGWCLIHRFQKQNTIIKTKYNLITDLESLYNLLSELINTFRDLHLKPNNQVLWSNCTQLTAELLNKNKIITCKIENLIALITKKRRERLSIKIKNINLAKQISQHIELFNEALRKSVEKVKLEEISKSHISTHKKISELLVTILNPEKAESL